MAEKQTHGFLEQIRSPEISSCIYGQFFISAFNSPTSVTTPVRDFFFFSLIFDRTMGHAVSEFPNQKSNPCPCSGSTES